MLVQQKLNMGNKLIHMGKDKEYRLIRVLKTEKSFHHSRTFFGFRLAKSFQSRYFVSSEEGFNW